MARNIMRAFKMMEISSVDRPAQIHARATILKRHRDNPGNTDPEPVPAPGLNPEEVSMTQEQLKKMIDDAVGVAIKDISKSSGPSEDDIKKRLETAVTDALAKAQANWDKGLAAAIEKGVKDEIAKRDEIAKGDETFTYDGKEIRKSAVGESTYAMLKGLYEKDQNSEFGKRADAEFKMLPGTTVEKGAVLRAIASLPEAVAKSANAMLAAGQKAMADMLKSAGRDGNGTVDGDAQSQIDALVAKAMADDKNLSKTDALNRVMQTSEGQDLYKRAGNERKARAA